MSSRYGNCQHPALLNVETIRASLNVEFEAHRASLNVEFEALAAILNVEFETKVAEEMASARIRYTAESLVLVTDGDKTVSCIRILRTAFGLGLREAKDAYDAALDKLNREVGTRRD